MVDRIAWPAASHQRGISLHVPGRLLVVALAALVCALVPAIEVSAPGTVRYVFAGLVVLDLAVVGMIRPRIGIALTLLFLVCLGMVRRLLIPAAGWSSFDPLLLVGPAVGILLLARALFARRLAARDLLSRLVLLLVCLTSLDVLNPTGYGVAANLIGLLFVAAPLLWFFVGQAFADRLLAARLLPAAAVVAGLVAAYGLVQTLVGLPGWDQAWVTATGYAALRVGATVRAFGSFASAAEYAAFLGAGVVIVAGAVTLRRVAMLLLLPLLVVALFLESSRGIVLFTSFAALLAAALRTGRAWRAGAVVATGIAVVLVGGRLATPAVQSAAEQSGDPLVTHQVQGLTDPLNPESSTLLLHWQLVVGGITGSVSHPLGLGPAATNLAGTRLAGDQSGAEVDLVNEFTDVGLAGGLLLLAVVGITLSRAMRLSLRTRDPAMVALTGVLVVTLGQWLNGGFYAMSALVWLLAGIANAGFVADRAQRRAAAGEG